MFETATETSQDSHIPTIVKGFFDLGRENWAGRVEGPHIAPWASEVDIPELFVRPNQVYLDRFAKLAPIKNPMVIFTEARFHKFVSDARAAHGLADHTHVVVCKSPFKTSISLDSAIKRTLQAISRHEYRAFIKNPHCPENWNADYVAMTMFKFSLVTSAIQMGLVKTPNLAWIDFGYCRDDERFDKTKAWTFPCRDKIHLFHVRQPDDRPIFDIVRSGDFYFMACHMVSPTAQWATFFDLIEGAFSSLLDCGLPDDEQTAMMMAYRRIPSLFHIHAVDPSDWFVIFRRTWT